MHSISEEFTVSGEDSNDFATLLSISGDFTEFGEGIRGCWGFYRIVGILRIVPDSEDFEDFTGF